MGMPGTAEVQGADAGRAAPAMRVMHVDEVVTYFDGFAAKRTACPYQKFDYGRSSVGH